MDAWPWWPSWGFGCHGVKWSEIVVAEQLLGVTCLPPPPPKLVACPWKVGKPSRKGSSSKLRGCIMDSDLTRNCLLGWSTNELNKKLAKIHEVLGILIWEESRLVICSHLPCFKGYINWTRCNSRAFLASQVDLALKEMIYVKIASRKHIWTTQQHLLVDRKQGIISDTMIGNLGIAPTIPSSKRRDHKSDELVINRPCSITSSCEVVLAEVARKSMSWSTVNCVICVNIM